ncbi:MAG: hypothetical protein AAFQ75_01585 [Pseudomonadota bacterium]
MAADQYITLVSSLPALGPVLGAKHAPINRARLQKRLRLLTPEHHAELMSLADLLAWSRLPLAGNDEALVSRARRVIPALSSPTLAALARDRLEMRTVTAALRRRKAGQEAPQGDEAWGYSRYLVQITANWNDPEFGLTRVYPWLPEARMALEKHDAQGLERVLLEAAWRHASRHAVGHDFDYEAVAIYVIRWNLLDRWTRYDEQAAAARFASLVDQALATAPEQRNEREAAA